MTLTDDEVSILENRLARLLSNMPFDQKWQDEHSAFKADLWRMAPRLLSERADHIATIQRLTDAGWMPIETAPAMNGGDTVAVLVWCPARKNIHTAWWSAKLTRWEHFGGYGAYPMQEEPTHWKPIPAPPTKAEIARVALLPDGEEK